VEALVIEACLLGGRYNDFSANVVDHAAGF